MANPTQRNNLTGKKSFSQTMRQGAKVLGGRDVANYTLTYINATKSHRQGDFQTIVIPYVELGRSSDCVVQFGDEYSTVSRKHAALRMDNGRVMLKHLSATNPTIIRRGTAGTVEQLTMENQEAELQNGDTLQLSNDGPSIRFNATETRTSSMGFTQRMQLFSQQALKPYRYAVGVLALLLIVLGAGSWYVISEQGGKIKEQGDDIAALTIDLDDAKTQADQARTELEQLEASGQATAAQLKQQRQQLAAALKKQKDLEEQVSGGAIGSATSGGGSVAGGATSSTSMGIGQFKPSVYFLKVDKVEATINGEASVFDLSNEEKLKWSGTGFLTTDGKFVTARHVVQGWRFSPELCSDLTVLNAMEVQGGSIRITFRAESPDGDAFNFSFDYVKLDDSNDELAIADCKGRQLEVRYCDPTRAFSDWAFIQFNNRKGNIEWSAEVANSLQQGEQLHVLGYNHGEYLQTGEMKNLDPLYSTCMAGQTKNFLGMITVTNKGYESGASGGPVFAVRDGKYVAVGIVSLSLGSTGRVVALNQLF